jgi:4-diphosphocytidyl-2-C-methyl-D-erythritol kinase
MAALAFGDRLTVRRRDLGVDRSGSSSSSFVRKFVEADNSLEEVIDWPLEADLVFRGHAAVQARVGRSLPVEVVLEKRVPTGAGLGGGSGDAAAMILALDRLFTLGLDAADHHDLAEALGSDVHFALAVGRGQTEAIVSGVGERLDAFPPQRRDVVLVLPDFGCATGPVYAAFDRLGLGRPRDENLEAAEGIEASGGNDLESAAVEVQPRLGTLLRKLRDQLGLPARVTGSGAACFVLVKDATAAVGLAGRLTRHEGLRAVATHSLTEPPPFHGVDESR